MNSTKILFRQNVKHEDIDHVRNIVASTGFFYDFEIPVAVELVEAAVEEGDDSGYFFLFAEVEGKTVSYSCYGPIAGTDAGYDLYWIVTHNNYRGSGIGKQLLEETHRIVKNGEAGISSQKPLLLRNTLLPGFSMKIMTMTKKQL